MVPILEEKGHLGGAQVFSLPGMILADMAKIKQNNRDFKEIKKNLKKNYSTKKIHNLMKKHMKNPKKYQTELRILGNKFIQEYSKFRTNYGDLLKTIVELLSIAEKEEYKDLLSLQAIIQKIKENAKKDPQRFYFPKSAQKDFAKEFRIAMNDLAKQLAQDYVVFKKNSEGKRVKIGLFARLMSSRSASRQGMRAAGKLKKQVDALTEVRKHVQQELSQGGSPVLIMQLIQYVIQIEKTDKTMKDVKKDIEIVLQNVMEEVKEVVKYIAPFILLIENDIQIREKIAKARKNFIDQQHQIEGNLKNLAKWPTFGVAEIKSITAKEKWVEEKYL